MIDTQPNWRKWRVRMCVFVAALCLTWGGSGWEQSVSAAEPCSCEVLKSVDEVATLLQKELQPGSLLMHEGECLAVKVYTRSPFTHVAICLPDQQGAWQVYDSANGEGVRKSVLTEYLKECQRDELSVFHPCKALKESQKENLQAVLEEEIGRSYGIAHHLTGNSAEGLHCSEYVTQSLIAIDVLRAKKPARVSPASLRQGILEGNVYQEGTEFVLKPEIIPAPPTGGWCSRMWQETKSCTYACYQKMTRMCLCRD